MGYLIFVKKMIPFESCDLHINNVKGFCSIKHVVSYKQNPVH